MRAFLCASEDLGAVRYLFQAEPTFIGACARRLWMRGKMARFRFSKPSPPDSRCRLVLARHNAFPNTNRLD